MRSLHVGWGARLLALTVLLASTVAAGTRPARTSGRATRIEVARQYQVPAEASDALPEVDLEWRDERGAWHAVPPGPAPYVAGVVLDGAPLVRDVEGALWLFPFEGARLRLATDVVDGPVVSPDGKKAGWFSGSPGDRLELWIYDDAATRRLDRALAGSAGMRFSPSGDEIAFVAARAGGIAGLWLTPVAPHAAHCLTNCDLRAGSAWRDRYRPLPDLETLRFGERAVAYVDLEGHDQEAPR